MQKSIGDLYQHYQQANGVCTDTRQIKKGDIFFALKGPRFNANEMAAQALEKGASLAVIDDPAFSLASGTWLVEDVLLTLQDLSRFHRKHFNFPVIGLTGSNGKTTTKELLYAVLSQKYATVATKGNLNNHIGVPLTILSIPLGTEMAIIEMGANRLGDIAELCSIALPTHGFITNIGKAHIGTFGGAENILRGKTELFQHLLEYKGQVFIYSKDPVLAHMAKRFEHPMLFGNREDSYWAELLDAEPYIRYRSKDGELVQTHLLGAYNFPNILVALTLGHFFEVEEKAMHQAIAAYTPENNRSQIIQRGSLTIILDAYNANPSSMEAALQNLGKMKEQPKFVLVGDMFELGEESEKEHRKIGQLLSDLQPAAAWAVGKDMRFAKESFPDLIYFEKKEDLMPAFKNSFPQKGLLLIKGSRSMGLETLLDLP